MRKKHNNYLQMGVGILMTGIFSVMLFLTLNRFNFPPDAYGMNLFYQRLYERPETRIFHYSEDYVFNIYPTLILMSIILGFCILAWMVYAIYYINRIRKV